MVFIRTCDRQVVEFPPIHVQEANTSTANPVEFTVTAIIEDFTEEVINSLNCKLKGKYEGQRNRAPNMGACAISCGREKPKMANQDGSSIYVSKSRNVSAKILTNIVFTNRLAPLVVQDVIQYKKHRM